MMLALTPPALLLIQAHQFNRINGTLEMAQCTLPRTTQKQVTLMHNQVRTQ